MIQNQQPTHTTTTTTIHSLPKQTPHTINFSTRSLQPQLTHSLIHSLQLASKSETLCLWFHGAQQLTLSLQPSSHSVDSLEKSPPKEKKKPFSLLTFSHFSTNRMAQLHWTLFLYSSLLLLLCLLPLLHASAGDSDPIYRQVSSFSLSNFPWFQ